MLVCSECYMSPCECVYCSICGENLESGCETPKMDQVAGEIVTEGRCYHLEPNRPHYTNDI